MRLLIGAALAAFLAATPALGQTTTPAPAADPVATAQPSACGPLPAPPAVPDGANASRVQMEEASAALTAWAEQYRPALQCRRAEVAQYRANYDARLAEHNAAAGVLISTTQSFQAEATEWNQRNPRRDNPRTRRNIP